MLLSMVALVMLTSAHAAEPPADPLLMPGLESLSPSNKAAAFSGFISIFQIVTPHPDRELQTFIDRAKAGDADSFALVAWMVWRGSAGFRESRAAAKIALARAMKEGSAQAPYYIGLSFIRPELSQTDSERADNVLAGMNWLGISAGMGERVAFDQATKAIADLSKGSEQARQVLTRAFNEGIEQGAARKRSPPRERTPLDKWHQ